MTRLYECEHIKPWTIKWGIASDAKWCDKCKKFVHASIGWNTSGCPVHDKKKRTDGSAVECPVCGAKFGGMIRCPWDDVLLTPLPDADPIALAFYKAINDESNP